MRKNQRVAGNYKIVLAGECIALMSDGGTFRMPQVLGVDWPLEGIDGLLGIDFMRGRKLIVDFGLAATSLL